MSSSLNRKCATLRQYLSKATFAHVADRLDAMTLIDSIEEAFLPQWVPKPPASGVWLPASTIPKTGDWFLLLPAPYVGKWSNVADAWVDHSGVVNPLPIGWRKLPSVV